MRIRRVEVFAFRYHVEGGPFAMSGGRVAAEQDSTIVRVLTDDGLTGWGEQCSFSPAYLPGHADGVRAALKVLAPALIGCDPRQVERAHARLTSAMKGHEYAKSALDIACWDLFGKAVAMPVSELLGGTFQEQVAVYKAVGLDEPGTMARRCAELRDAGYRIVQVKLGVRPSEDLERAAACAAALSGLDRVIFDANGHWPGHEAVVMARGLSGLGAYLEQPCTGTEECRRARRHFDGPLILDESIAGLDELLAAWRAGALDAARIKLSRFGGITPVRRARDLCVALGIAVGIEDSAGGDIVAAATTHLAASVPPKYLLDGFVPSGEVVERLAVRPVTVHDGKVALPPGSGLGVEIDEARLGPVLASYE